MHAFSLVLSISITKSRRLCQRTEDAPGNDTCKCARVAACCMPNSSACIGKHIISCSTAGCALTTADMEYITAGSVEIDECGKSRAYHLLVVQQLLLLNRILVGTSA